MDFHKIERKVDNAYKRASFLSAHSQRQLELLKREATRKKKVTTLSLFTDVTSLVKMSLAEESCNDVWHQQHIYDYLININQRSNLDPVLLDLNDFPDVVFTAYK